MVVRGTGVRRRGIVRHGLEKSRLVIKFDDFVGNVQAGRKARRIFNGKIEDDLFLTVIQLKGRYISILISVLGWLARSG